MTAGATHPHGTPGTPKVTTKTPAPRLVRPAAFGYGRQLSWRAKGAEMAFGRNRRGGIGGISLGGVLVIVGIVVALAWSLLLGIIIAVIGLVAFGGFVRGKWY
jgi:hypothetical protein